MSDAAAANEPTTPLPEGLALTVLDPAFRANPHSALDRLRRECPVKRDETLGVWLLTRYADVRELLTDRTLWRDPDLAEPAAAYYHAIKGSGDVGMLLMDPPDHTRVRQTIGQAFYARVAKARGAVERIVAERLSALEGRDAFDLIADYAIPIPIEAIAYLLGADTDELPLFRIWSEGLFKQFHPARTPADDAALAAAQEGLGGYVERTMANRRDHPRDDLISDLVALQADGAPLSDEEIRINCAAFLAAGNTTTSDLIGSAVWLFLSHPAERAKLAAEPKLIAAAVEEALRLEPPSDITVRVAPRDMAVGGCPVATAQVMFPWLSAANRDPAAFPDPHRFDITREPTPHVSFGGGEHICIGQPLARLEARVAVAAILARWPTLRLADPEAAPRWREIPWFRGLERLPVRV